jgi:hypothetical protein
MSTLNRSSFFWDHTQYKLIVFTNFWDNLSVGTDLLYRNVGDKISINAA